MYIATLIAGLMIVGLFFAMLSGTPPQVQTLSREESELN
jgi:hypothetical protein